MVSLRDMQVGLDRQRIRAASDAKARSDVDGEKASLVHSHAIDDVAGLQDALDAKQATGAYAPAGHGHSLSDIADLVTELDAIKARLNALEAP